LAGKSKKRKGKPKRCGKNILASLKLETAILDRLKISGEFEKSSARDIRQMSARI